MFSFLYQFQKFKGCIGITADVEFLQEGQCSAPKPCQAALLRNVGCLARLSREVPRAGQGAATRRVVDLETF